MKRKISLFLFSAVLTLLLGGFGRVFACGSNPYVSSVCEMYGSAKTVFTGKILHIKEFKSTIGNNDAEIIFQVEEAFLNAKKLTQTTVILSGTSIDYCGFEEGKRFLVYAYKGDKGFGIDAGTRTRPIEEADEDLAFLRGLKRIKSGSRIYGTVNQIVRSSLEDNNKQPLSALKLKFEQLDGKRQIFETITDIEGKYEVTDVPSGKYKIIQVNPSGAFDFLPRDGIYFPVEVSDKGCARQNFILTTKNKLSGRVVDAEGKPVDHINVEIISIGAKKPSYIGEERGQTGSDGSFVSYNIPPGLYTLSVNYGNPPEEENPFPAVFYPGVKDKSQATIFEIKAGEEIKNIEFQLPPRLNKKVVKGLVVWADGTPAVGVEVYLKDNDFDACCINHGIKTDEWGSFTQVGFESRNYRIWATGNKNNSGKNEVYGISAKFSADDEKKQLTVILNMTEEQFEKEFDNN